MYKRKQKSLVFYIKQKYTLYISILKGSDYMSLVAATIENNNNFSNSTEKDAIKALFDELEKDFLALLSQKVLLALPLMWILHLLIQSYYRK